jgi:AmiR/NasT family two-component response regulator
VHAAGRIGSEHRASDEPTRAQRIRRWIEKAKGRLAEQYRISHGEAFDILAALSSNSNRKLRDFAAELLKTR